MFLHLARHWHGTGTEWHLVRYVVCMANDGLLLLGTGNAGRPMCLFILFYLFQSRCTDDAVPAGEAPRPVCRLAILHLAIVAGATSSAIYAGVVLRGECARETVKQVEWADLDIKYKPVLNTRTRKVYKHSDIEKTKSQYVHLLHLPYYVSGGV